MRASPRRSIATSPVWYAFRACVCCDSLVWAQCRNVKHQFRRCHVSRWRGEGRDEVTVPSGYVTRSPTVAGRGLNPCIPIDRLARLAANAPLTCRNRREGKAGNVVAPAERLACRHAVLCAPAHAQMPGGPPAVGVVRAQADRDHRDVRIHRPHPGDGPRRADAARDGVPGAAAVHRRRGGQAGRSVYRLELAPSRPRVQQQQAAVAEASARLANANIQLNRAQRC